VCEFQLIKMHGETVKFLGSIFQLQRAIIWPKTEQSPGTFSDCALHGILCTLVSTKIHRPEIF